MTGAAEGREGLDRPGNLAGQRVLLVHGLMGEVMAALRPIGLDYMHGLAAWLRAQGAEVDVVRLPTAAPIARNAERLREVLLAEPSPVLLIAHSKGGLEALAALLDPVAAARCTGFVALQSPFFGSPIADAVTRARPLDAAAMGLARLLRIGNGEGLRDLTTTRRAAWMEAHAQSIAALLARLPVVCLATALPARSLRGRDRIYGLAARWMAQRGAWPSDGLVPVASALLPGAHHLLRDGSHIASVSRGGGRDPAGLLAEALAVLGLSREGAPPIPDGRQIE
ncbi:hypothetical protein GXW71_18720 [Roseomonas hellenica]|uniref:Alpha/beta hydrolase n=1 Tax=Plastoroseomonas hellenica TaxID=2687306 RepID=A0ABS5F1K0_9PROT|nr:hypothetical protein [Plastoroseomonas hellenica]MBR0666401.1 hypothetical protein [Plastoroseomonas hellenica]